MFSFMHPELRAAGGLQRKTGKAAPRRLSGRHRTFITKLVEKHGDDLEVSANPVYVYSPAEHISLNVGYSIYSIPLYSLCVCICQGE